jgi:hypothetical protein
LDNINIYSFSKNTSINRKNKNFGTQFYGSVFITKTRENEKHGIPINIRKVNLKIKSKKATNTPKFA